MRLHQLPKNRRASVSGIVDDDPSLAAKLREVGFAEADDVEIVHTGPLNGKPLCVRLNRTLIALRAEEAAAIEVELGEPELDELAPGELEAAE